MRHELLAPAGNLEAGYAALHYGADAVYLGLTKFSARAGAENFTPAELDQLTAYAHSLNRKVFVALNTILTEQEIKELPEIITILKQTKIDAVIIQDLGVFYLMKKLAPEIELHASTQMAVHNLEGAKFLHSLGFKRIVLARELNINEIKGIAKALPDVDLEVFIHGALCYSYSGQCLFSALEYGKSANRGRCAYPCRANYCHENSSFKEHYFSMKDLALAEDVLKLPVLSLKIEGRKKSPLYVAAVTNYYRHILDGHKKNLNEAEDIKQIFSRPWCKFHLFEKAKDVTDRNFVGHRGLLIGKVEQIRGHSLCFRTSHDIARYDGLQIDIKGDEKPFGFAIKNISANKQKTYEAKANQTVEVELPPEHPHIEIGAPIYLASSSAVKGRYNYSKPRPGTFRNAKNLALRIEITADKIWALCEDVAVSVSGHFEPTDNINNTKEAILKAFSKTTKTSFIFDDITIINPDCRFTPASLLNNLRRKLVEELAQKQKEQSLALPQLKPYTASLPPIKINIIDIELNETLQNLSSEQIDTHWFRLPQICRNTAKLSAVIDSLYQQGVRHFIAENYYAFELLKNKKDIILATGSFLYVMNSYAAATLKEFGVQWAPLALESSPENMNEVLNNSPLPLAQVTKAYPPLFTSAVCLRENDCAHCSKKEKSWHLKANGKEYLARSKNCQMQIFATMPYQRQALSGVYGYIEQSEI